MKENSQIIYKPQIKNVHDCKTIFGCHYLLVSYAKLPETFMQWLREEEVIKFLKMHNWDIKGLQKYGSS
jgi:hypothetical protein